MEATLSILKKLISIDTRVDISTLEAVSFIADYLQGYHIKSHLIYKDHQGKEDKKRASLIASIGDTKKPGLILSAHLDTVGIAGQENKWASDPFSLRQDENKVYGRGVVDMKGAISVALSNIDILKRISTHIPVHLVFTHDEEGGFTGINQLIDNRFYDLIPTRQIGCVVMEATNMQPIYAHRGTRRIDVNILGKSTHISTPHKACDALMYAIDIYKYAQKEFSQTQWNVDDRFAYNRAVLNISKMAGGFSDMFISGDSHFSMNCSYLDGDDVEAFFHNVFFYIEKKKKEMKKKHPASDITVAEKYQVLPFSTNEDVLISKIVKEATKNIQDDGIELSKISLNYKNFFYNGTTSYGTEAGHFHKLGIDTIICGPGGMQSAHEPNEYLTFSQIKKANMFFKNLENTINKIQANQR